MKSDESEARRAILARRARFIAAALAGFTGCRGAPPAEPVPSVVTVAEPETVPHAETDAGEAELPERAAAPDRDNDGVPDADDQCPDDPGPAVSMNERVGCPDNRPRVCLSEF